ncbi:hypothetical protein RI129_011431 [Pyrocoelia pectoralis]|uniref:Uncharacterized protein n=1 Tax=Pyrocoelia pectoralis TaxID=417401 RepID=A0AAN7V147_9COLE
MEKIHLLSLLGYLYVQSTLASNCYQQMNYEKLYGYKYDINCNNLNETNIEELQGIIIKTKVKLTITNSNLTTITSKFFKNIPNTKELVIKSSILPLSKTLFTHLDRLDVLILEKLSTEELPQGFLGGLKNLRVLKLSHNNLRYLPNDTFSQTGLQELDLSFNHFTDFTIPCELQQLSLLHLAHNQLVNLQNFSLHCFPLLHDLNLSHNKITSLKPLEPVRYLQKLDVSHNLLEDIGDSLADLENLNELNLAGNHFKHTSEDSFKTLPHLTSLDLSNNSLTSFSWVNLSSLQKLNLEMNYLTKIPLLNITSLVKLSLSHNRLTLDHNLNTFPNLTELRLSHCNIGEINKQLNNLKSLEILDLSYSNVSVREVLSLNRLRELDLSGNSIGSWRRFELSGLEILNLSRNALEELDEEVFTGCGKVGVLDLSHNHLELLPEHLLNPLEGLRELHLHNNKLRFLPYGDIVSRHKGLGFLSVGENKFSCQFLSEMVYYFGANHIKFGFKHEVDDYNENVAGIHCHEVRSSDSDSISDYSHSDSVYNSTSSGTLILVIVSVILALLSFTILVLYKIAVFVRKRTNMDEIELIERRFRLRNYL